MKERILTYCNAGLIDYQQAWDLQRKVFELRLEGKTGDTLFLLEHPNTYTLGKTADRKHLTGSQSFLDDNKISVYEIDRGGDITYHGPGQIVGYPVISLTDWQQDTHKYLRALEEVIIKVCAFYGIEGTRNPRYTGVWTGGRKIAAIGIKVSRWITMHGFAFNVNTDLDLFTGIIPCGISDKEVTSLERETGSAKPLPQVNELLKKYFMEVFGYSSVREESKETMFHLVNDQKILKGA